VKARGRAHAGAAARQLERSGKPLTQKPMAKAHDASTDGSARITSFA
jgi:hypothetical protein